MSTQTVELRHDPTDQGGGYVRESGERIELVTHWEIVKGAYNLNFAKGPKVLEDITLPACGACEYTSFCSWMDAEAGNAVVSRNDDLSYVDASATLRLPKARKDELLSQLKHAVGRNGKILDTIYEFDAPLPCAGTSVFTGEIG